MESARLGSPHGKIRRRQPAAAGRIASGEAGGEKTVAQVALNWRPTRPTAVNVVIGTRDEAQQLHNLGAVGWTLDADELARLDAASHETPIDPYCHQKGFDSRNPKPTAW